MDNRCVICGNIIPEGREMCPACEENGRTEYKSYLGRLGRVTGESPAELHKRALSREVARSYGMTEDQIEELDKSL